MHVCAGETSNESRNDREKSSVLSFALIHTSNSACLVLLLLLSSSSLVMMLILLFDFQLLADRTATQ